jgi:hypothetical protein
MMDDGFVLILAVAGSLEDEIRWDVYLYIYVYKESGGTGARGEEKELNDEVCRVCLRPKVFAVHVIFIEEMEVVLQRQA